DEVVRQVPPVPLLRSRLERLNARVAKDATFGKQIGAFLYRMMDSNAVAEIVPQFNQLKGGTMSTRQFDQKFAQSIPLLETFRGIFEGIEGLETTMLCQLKECPFHRFRICGRVSFVPDDANSCRQRHALETVYELTPELIATLKPTNGLQHRSSSTG